jgi:hypothetical protein
MRSATATSAAPARAAPTIGELSSARVGRAVHLAKPDEVVAPSGLRRVSAAFDLALCCGSMSSALGEAPAAACQGDVKLAMPPFPVDALEAPATSAGRVHNVLGIATFLLFPVAALLLFRALRRIGSRLAPAIAVVLAIATVGVLVGNAVGVYGLTQRAYLVLCALWLLFAAIAVLRTSVGQRRGLAPTIGVGERLESKGGDHPGRDGIASGCAA